MIRRAFYFAGLSLAAFCLSGCSSGDTPAKPETVNVSGTVYLDGKPAAGVDVNFLNEETKFASFGKTGPDGKYTLVQGAVVGTNKVVLSKIEGEGIELNPEEGMDEGQLQAAADAGGSGGAKALNLPQQLIPDEYSDPAKSKLTYDVPAAGTDGADFRVTSK